MSLLRSLTLIEKPATVAASASPSSTKQLALVVDYIALLLSCRLDQASVAQTVGHQY
jgi:hypothetical protein